MPPVTAASVWLVLNVSTVIHVIFLIGLLYVSVNKAVSIVACVTVSVCIHARVCSKQADNWPWQDQLHVAIVMTDESSVNPRHKMNVVVCQQ